MLQIEASLEEEAEGILLLGDFNAVRSPEDRQSGRYNDADHRVLPVVDGWRNW